METWRKHKVILMGRAGKDAEVRYTPNRTAIASLTLATEISYSDNEGKEQKKRNGMILSFLERKPKQLGSTSKGYDAVFCRAHS